MIGGLSFTNHFVIANAVSRIYKEAVNYPNPFTTIEYELTQARQIELTIYNVLGQRIRTPVNEWQPPGTYRVSWDGKSGAVEFIASSGIYFYELRHGDLSIRRKMALLR